MRHLALALALTIGGWLHVSTTTEVPASVIDQALKSVYLLHGTEEHGRYACTAWLAADELAVTANHCTKGEQVDIAGFSAVLVDNVEYFDLAAYKVTGLHGTALEVRTYPVKRFEWVAALGQAYGWRKPSSFHARVYHTNISPTEDWCPGFLVRPGYIGGMSGGPVIDESGLVVGVVLASNQDLGYAVGTPHLTAFLSGVL